MRQYFLDAVSFILIFSLLVCSLNAVEIIGLYYQDSQCQYQLGYISRSDNECHFDSTINSYLKFSQTDYNDFVFYQCTDISCNSCSSQTFLSNPGTCNSVASGFYVKIIWSTSCTNQTNQQQVMILQYSDINCNSFIDGNTYTNNYCHNLTNNISYSFSINSSSQATLFICQGPNCETCNQSAQPNQGGVCQPTSTSGLYEQILWSSNCSQQIIVISNGSSSHLSARAIVGIVIGALFLIAVIFFIVRQRCNSKHLHSVAYLQNNNQKQANDEPRTVVSQNQQIKLQQQQQQEQQYYNYPMALQQLQQENDHQQIQQQNDIFNQQNQMGMMVQPYGQYQYDTDLVPPYQIPSSHVQQQQEQIKEAKNPNLM